MGTGRGRARRVLRALHPAVAGADVRRCRRGLPQYPWLGGVARVFADIAARGEHSAVISLSPQFFVERLLDWGVASAHGARVEAGVAVDPALVLTPASKVIILEHLLTRYGLADHDTVAYGDSSSDIPLFARLGNTVSVNGTESLRAQAARHYEGTDLWSAYELGRSLLDADRVEHSSSTRRIERT